MILAGLMSYLKRPACRQPCFRNNHNGKTTQRSFKSTLSSVFLEHSLCFRRYNDCYGSHRRVSFIRINEFEVPFKNVVIALMISLLMVPYESIIFTNYQTIAQLGLLNTYSALIIPF